VAIQAPAMPERAAFWDPAVPAAAMRVAEETQVRGLPEGPQRWTSADLQSVVAQLPRVGIWLPVE
jgi:hypothetical protein